MSLLDVIKQVSTNAMTTQNPVQVIYATVLRTAPLAVQVEQKFTLTDDFLVRTEAARNLAPGDRVVLLRVQGGGQFLVVDKVVS